MEKRAGAADAAVRRHARELEISSKQYAEERASAVAAHDAHTRTLRAELDETRKRLAADADARVADLYQQWEVDKKYALDSSRQDQQKVLTDI